MYQACNTGKSEFRAKMRQKTKRFQFLKFEMYQAFITVKIKFNPTLVTWDVQTCLVTWGVCAPQSKNSIYGGSNNF